MRTLNKISRLDVELLADKASAHAQIAKEEEVNSWSDFAPVLKEFLDTGSAKAIPSCVTFLIESGVIRENRRDAASRAFRRVKRKLELKN